MNQVYVVSLLIITAIDLLRADGELTSRRINPRSWLSANVINDGSILEPRPLSELFPSDENFSSINPIIVLSTTESSSHADNTFWSDINTSQRDIKNPISTEKLPLSFTTTTTPSPSTSELGQDLTTHVIKTNSEIKFPTAPELQSLFTKLPLSTDNDQLRRHYFLIYQQAPQSFPPIFPVFKESSTQGAVTITPTAPPPTQSSTFTPVTTFSSMPWTSMLPSKHNKITQFPTWHTSPSSTYSTLPHPITTSTIHPGEVSIKTHSSRLTTFSHSTSTPKANVNPYINSTHGLPYLRIRIAAPSGSITRVKINEPTTTRRPTTIRNRTRKLKNDYDVCIDSCKKRNPICAAPFQKSKGLIDPETLKGFASVCHMACYNSFKFGVYEKVIDGRCGKLRTRVRTIDSEKLRKQELDKAQYTVIYDPPQTVVEFRTLHKRNI